ncbi:MAG: hypothetical protein NTY66_02550 [Candidatus Vogelbacteria bacterium]|nr:hypothetical protein [Candidatus Vogelbacteria bacterium]
MARADLGSCSDVVAVTGTQIPVLLGHDEERFWLLAPVAHFAGLLVSV